MFHPFLINTVYKVPVRIRDASEQLCKSRVNEFEDAFTYNM